MEQVQVHICAEISLHECFRKIDAFEGISNDMEICYLTLDMVSGRVMQTRNDMLIRLEMYF